ncbi:MAG TPA: TadE family protein [Gaiellaceae bacterium]|nr:TadE family protein [Gaiellaceae bacterium]
MCVEPPLARSAARRALLPFLRERGQAVVEFALVLPVFMLLLIGMIDFGNAFSDHNDLSQLAAEAARFAAVNSCGTGCGTTNTAIMTQVQNDADNYGLKNGGGGVWGTDQPLRVCFNYPTGSTGAVGDQVQAIVETNYRWFPFLNLGKVQLKATATMRIEQSPATTYVAGTNLSNCSNYTS